MIDRGMVRYPEQFTARLSKLEREIERLSRRVEKLERSA